MCICSFVVVGEVVSVMKAKTISEVTWRQAAEATMTAFVQYIWLDAQSFTFNLEPSKLNNRIEQWGR